MTKAKKERKQRGITKRIQGYICITIVIVIVVVIFILGSILGGMIIRKNRALHYETTQKVAQEITGWFGEQVKAVEMLANTISYYSSENEQLGAFLAECLEENPAVFDYYIGFEDKSLVSGSGWSPSPEEYDPTGRDWYQEAAASEGVAISSA